MMDWEQQWKDVNPQRGEDALGEQVERCLQQGEHLTAVDWTGVELGQFYSWAEPQQRALATAACSWEQSILPFIVHSTL